MSAFTCIACKLICNDAEGQRTHYKTDWHRYNLKQQVAQLPPITEDTFNEKLNQYSKNKLAAAIEVSFNCQACCKVFATGNAYQNHLKSKKHLLSKDNGKQGHGKKKADSADESKQVTDSTSALVEDTAASLEKEDKVVEDTVEDTAASLEKEDKVIEDTVEDTVEDTAASLEKEDTVVESAPVTAEVLNPHAELDDFIEDIMGDDDSDGWEDVDSDEEVDDEDDDDISEALPPETCLFCPHQSVNIDDSLRHMFRSHSFFIPDIEYVTDIEAFLAYLGSKVGDGKCCLKCNLHSKQFMSIYACQLHMRDKGHCMLDYEGDAAIEYGDFYDFTATYPDNESNDVDDELSSAMGELSVDPDTMELILPSGGRAGHRALRRYFDQSVPIGDVRPSVHHRALLSSMSSHYRASAISKVETRLSVTTRQRMQKIENRDRFRRDLAISVKNNKCDGNRFFRKQFMYAG